MASNLYSGRTRRRLIGHMRVPGRSLNARHGVGSNILVSAFSAPSASRPSLPTTAASASRLRACTPWAIMSGSQGGLLGGKRKTGKLLDINTRNSASTAFVTQPAVGGDRTG